MSLSLRKHLFGGTVWWEKLKFSEKSQIWENLSVGGPEASFSSTGQGIQRDRSDPVV